MPPLQFPDHCKQSKLLSNKTECNIKHYKGNRMVLAKSEWVSKSRQSRKESRIQDFEKINMQFKISNNMFKFQIFKQLSRRVSNLTILSPYYSTCMYLLDLWEFMEAKWREGYIHFVDLKTFSLNYMYYNTYYILLLLLVGLPVEGLTLKKCSFVFELKVTWKSFLMGVSLCLPLIIEGSNIRKGLSDWTKLLHTKSCTCTFDDPGRWL